jgi:hypothetical protein
LRHQRSELESDTIGLIVLLACLALMARNECTATYD